MQVIGYGVLLLPLFHVLGLASDVEGDVTGEDMPSQFIPPLPDVDLDLGVADHSDKDASKVCTMGIKCGSDSGVSVELPVQGIMGAPGPAGEPGPRGPPGVPGPPGDSWRNDCNVAFYVGLGASHDFSYMTSNIPLVFDKVVTNRGNAYDVPTGQFTAPYNGTYIFYVTVSAQEERKGAVSVQVNDVALGKVWAESFNDWGSASNTYILDLTSGDRVGLMLLKDARYLYAGMYTAFSGMCLWRNDPEV